MTSQIQNLAESNAMEPAEVVSGNSAVTAFVFARPRYVAYAQYTPDSTSFEWSILTVPAHLSGSSFNTVQLVNVMRRMIQHFKCSAHSHEIIQDCLAEGTPMGYVLPQAVARYVENDAAIRLMQGWSADVSAAEVDSIQRMFHPALEECVIPQEEPVQASDDFEEVRDGN